MQAIKTEQWNLWSPHHSLSVYLQIGCKGVRKPHVAWKGTEDKVTELDAVGRDNVTEAIMVITQELWEVVEQNQEHPQCALNNQ